jgi:HK97 family phage major capsid protein
MEPDRQHIVRDLLITLTTASNSIEWVQENVFTNSAAPQAGEGAAKAKSDITFTKQNSPVQTIAHWIAASRQVLADSRSLRSVIDNRLIYGLKFEEEDQLLLGDGTGNNLHGLVPQATAYNTGLNVSGDTKVDQLRRAILQVSQNKFMTNAIVLNPQDWCDLELTKTSDNAYLFSNPVNPGQPRIWGRRVVEGLSMTAGEFLLGDFGRAATLWDRELATIRVSEHHANFFVENMVALLCEERLALTVEHPLGLVTGTLAATP